MKTYMYEVCVEVPTKRTVYVRAQDEDEAHTKGVQEACSLVGGRKEDAHVEYICVNDETYGD